MLPPGRPSLARNAKGIPGKRISLRQTVGGHTAPCVETGVQFADPLPAGSVYVSIRDNYSKADDAKLRFVPYFGENDDIHVEKTDLFDLDCDSETDGFDEETDYVVGRVIGRHGRSPTILAALSQVSQWSAAVSAIDHPLSCTGASRVAAVLDRAIRNRARREERTRPTGLLPCFVLSSLFRL